MHFIMSSAICFNLDQFKILSSGNGLICKVLEPASVDFADTVDQDQAAHKVQSDLRSTLLVALLHILTKITCQNNLK